MKNALQMAALYVFAVLWLGPLAVGILDGWCWFFAAAQCTSIDWAAHDQVRAFIVFLWTVAFPLATLAVIGRLS